MKKELIGIFICMLLVGTIVPVTGYIIVDKTPLSFINGKTLYVGGSGPGNYSTIQDAINDAGDGDTVFVYDYSSPYYENLVVDKSIFLIGEDKETTIIYGNKIGNVIEIISDGVTVSGFRIINEKTEYGNYACVDIYGNNTEFSFNIIENSEETGIGVMYDDYYKNLYYHGIVISNNIIRSNSFVGIYLIRCTHSKITNNIILNNGLGIATYLANNNIISGNEISNNKNDGISLFSDSNNNEISGNSITNNKIYGIYIYDAGNNKILKNNIMGNRWRDAKFVYEITELKRNKWSNNYWGISTSIPYLIRGRISLYSGFQGIGIIPWFHIDWNPASEPYDIEV